MLKTKYLLILIVCLVFALIGYSADDWQSPTGFIDYSTEWGSETNLYDEDTGTQAFEANVPANSWCAWIGLTRAALNCDKVRFWAPYNASSQDQAQVEVYYASDWHSVYNGTYANLTWVEAALDGAHEITTVRVRFYNTYYASTGIYFNEFDFNQAEEVTAATNILFTFGNF